MASKSTGGGGEEEQEARVDAVEYNRRWLDIWGGGLPPGQSFDAGGVSPTLQRLLDSGELGVEGKRFLVPGCGRGYDAYAAARAGASIAVGLDLSAKAVAAAEGHHSREPADVRARVRLVAGDFFAFQDEQPFDLGYDYTFLCALHPSMRREWAAAWARHLRPGTGRLVAMVYPVDPGRTDGGPPWPVTPELYRSLLEGEGEEGGAEGEGQGEGGSSSKKDKNKRGGPFALESLEPIPPSQSRPATRGGREWIGIWRRV